MAIPDWQDAQLKGAVHVRGDSVGKFKAASTSLRKSDSITGSIAPVKPYNPINQRDIDDEMGHVDPDPFGNAYASSSSASKGTPALSPFKSLKSVGFAFSVVLCIALAVVLSKVSPPGMNDGQFDDSGLSALDCSRIQTIGVRKMLLLNVDVFWRQSSLFTRLTRYSPLRLPTSSRCTWFNTPPTMIRAAMYLSLKKHSP